MDPRDQRIAELETLLRAALDRITTLEARVSTLEAENAELRARVRQNSHNSSKPPSSDPPGAAPRTSAPTGKKPGGQPGHKGTKRELVPTEQADIVVSVAADKCTQCSSALVQRDGAPAARRHQVVELPRVKPHITEYQLGFGYCPCCED